MIHRKKNRPVSLLSLLLLFCFVFLSLLFVCLLLIGDLLKTFSNQLLVILFFSFSFSFPRPLQSRSLKKHFFLGL